MAELLHYQHEFSLTQPDSLPSLYSLHPAVDQASFVPTQQVLDVLGEDSPVSQVYQLESTELEGTTGSYSSYSSTGSCGYPEWGTGTPAADELPRHNILLQRVHSKRARSRPARGGDDQKRELYKRAACERERARMKSCNKIFSHLRATVPNRSKRLSKIETLRLAIKYIKHLKYLLSFPADQPLPDRLVQFDPSSDAWDRLLVTADQF